MDFIDLDAAVYDRMAQDPTLTALLSTYSPGLGSTASNASAPSRGPAIFTDREVPEDAELPYVWSHGQITDIADDTKLQPGRDIVRDISCFTARNETDLIERIASRIRALFHRHELAIDGAQTIVAEVSGPVITPTDEQVLGRSLSLRLRFENT